MHISTAIRPSKGMAALLIAVLAGFATAGAAAASEPIAEPDAPAALEAPVEPAPAESAPAPDAGETEQPAAPDADETHEPEPTPASDGAEAPQAEVETEVEAEEEPDAASGIETELAPLAFAAASTPAPLPSTVEANGCTFDVEYSESDEVSVTDIRGCADVEVPAILEGMPVVKVGGGDRMTGAAGFTSLVLPGTVRAIADRAFTDADALVSVTFSEGLERIGGGAFRGSDSLLVVTLPSSMSSIGGGAFQNVSSLVELDLGGTATVGKLAFSGTSLPELTIPATVTSVGDTGFGNIDELRQVTVEGDPSAFTKFTFLNDRALEKIVFLSTQPSASIGANAFVEAGASVEGGPVAFFHDGAFGFECDAELRELFVGGTTFATRCLYEVLFADDVLLGLQFLPHVEEGTVLTDADVTVEPFAEFGERFVGWDPALPHTVTDDVEFSPVFEPIAPGDYTPSEDDLLQDFEIDFGLTGAVTAGEAVTLLLPVQEGGGEGQEPLPTGPLPSLASVQGSPVPAEELQEGLDEGGPDVEAPDPNDLIDIVLFSTPVELEIVGLDVSAGTVTVRIPADTTPGAHKIAVYSVFGDLFGWQSLTVLAPAAPEGGTPGSGSGSGDEGAGDDGQGASGGASGGADPTSDAGAEGAVDGSDIGALASTGGEPQTLLIAIAVLLGVGGVLVAARRWAR